MQCLILAGGLGTRMKSVSQVPKALLPVGNLTFIDYQLQWLKILGISEVILALGHQSQEIESHLGHCKLPIPKIDFSYDGPKLLGTGGAIKKAKKLLKDNFIVMYGDSFLVANLEDFQTQHLLSRLPLTLSIYKNHNKGDTSNVIYRDGKILKYDKVNLSPEMEFIDYGMSFIERDFFLSHTPDEGFDFASFISQTCAIGKAHPFVASEPFHEIGSPSGYEEFQNFLTSYDFDLQKLAHRKVYARPS